MQLHDLIEYMKEEIDLTIDILERYGFFVGSMTSDYIKLGHSEEGKKQSIVLYTESLRGMDFSRDEPTDVFKLLRNEWGYDFESTVLKVSCLMGLEDCETIEFTPTPPEVLEERRRLREEALKTPAINIGEEVLNNYPVRIAQMFLDDNISITTQIKFGIRYDYTSCRIIIPLRNELGELVGLEGRCNLEVPLDERAKYMPVGGYNYNKGKVLYGYSESYDVIKEKGYVWVIESNKSKLQAHTLHVENVCSLGKASISEYQLRLIASLPCDRVILALDEGLEIKVVQKQINKLKTIDKKIGFLPQHALTYASKNNLFDEEDFLEQRFLDEVIWVS